MAIKVVAAKLESPGADVLVKFSAAVDDLGFATPDFKVNIGMAFQAGTGATQEAANVIRFAAGSGWSGIALGNDWELLGGPAGVEVPQTGTLVAAFPASPGITALAVSGDGRTITGTISAANSGAASGGLSGFSLEGSGGITVTGWVIVGTTITFSLSATLRSGLTGGGPTLSYDGMGELEFGGVFLVYFDDQAIGMAAAPNGIDVSDLLLSIGAAMVAAAPTGLTLLTDLCIHLAIEKRADGTGGGANDPYSVLAIYGGPAPDVFRPVVDLSIQCMTTARGGAAVALRRANVWFNTLYEDKGAGNGRQPRTLWSVPAKKMLSNGTVAADGNVSYQVLLVTTNGPPGVIGVDDTRRTMVSFNFEVKLTRTSS